MQIPYISSEEQKRIDERYYERQINDARRSNFCYTCGKFGVHCRNPNCAAGKRALESDAVHAMDDNTLLEIIRKIKGLQIHEISSDGKPWKVWDVQYRVGGYSVAFTTGRMGLESAVEKLLQVGICGTEVEFKDGVMTISKSPIIEKDIVAYGLCWDRNNIYFEAETVFDSRRVKPSS